MRPDELEDLMLEEARNQQREIDEARSSHKRLVDLGLRRRNTDPNTARPGAKDNTEDQRRIIEMLSIQPQGMNSRELSEALGRPRECISTCLRPMERLGLIKEYGKRYDPVTNSTVLVWGI